MYLLQFKNTSIMKKILISVSLLVTGCSGETSVDIPEEIAAMQNVAIYPGDADPLNNITLTEVARFGDTDELFIRSISGIDVDDRGTLFLADRAEATLHVYDAMGEYQYSIGRKGEGPGEFNAVYAPRLHENELYVLDVMQQRVSVFNPDDGTFLRDHPLGRNSRDTSGFPVSFSPITDNRFLVYYNRMRQDGDLFFHTPIASLLDENGNTLASDFIDFKPGEMFMLRDENSIQIMPLPFMRGSQTGLTRNETVLWGYTDRIFLKEISLEGEYIRGIYHARANPSLNRAAMMEQFDDDAVREGIRSLDIPGTRPAFQTFRIDDRNRIWLRLNTDDLENVEWWVLDETGEKLATFTRSEEEHLELVKREYIYFRQTDEDTGIQEIVKYRVEMESR
jgi:hypothetical protein